MKHDYDPPQSPPDPVEIDPEFWELRLYVAGQTAKSRAAIENLKRICDEYLPGKHHVEVIDLVQNPKLALTDQIVAMPTLIRRLPNPVRRLIGDLSNLERTLVSLQLRGRDA